MLGKISSLPNKIRDELHQRLADAQTPDTILAWLNSLPDTQAIVAEHFKGEPISGQNLSEYKKRGFRRWEIRQAALEFVSGDEHDAGSSPPEVPPVAPLVDRLVHWIATRFAAAAQTAPIPEDPEADLRDIRNFLTDIVSLRRGDLSARRLELEQERLAFERAKSEPEFEKRFWEWTKRPDIQARLYPHRDPDKLRRDAVRFLDWHLLGSRARFTPDAEPEPDPACLI